MMTNLFSTFDPATNIQISFNWISTFIGLLIMPLIYWVLPNRMNIVMMSISNKLHSEFKLLFSNKNYGLTLMMIAMFMFILTNNAMGLLPYVFTSSSHLVFTMTLAVPFWLSIMLYGWINHTNKMFTHLVPMGTPAMLMPFMVLIETVSNIIRPGSLAVRLTANMIAGHLLMSLLGNNSINNGNVIVTIIVVIQMMLMLFETAVAVIQAYVFSVLSALYSSEV
uniref:ATP synthase subunit a n=1 Tax=Tectocoris diophthalmus TaxID=159956 RepID=A0A2P1CLY4_9HEMI|nr:ATP synthase F0 subunit 6 [Tectocoris diophthalmus]